jgi:YidC/Oxa1 family membrane protein insertase
MNIIFQMLNNGLNHFYNITGDWGVAIVLLTILVRIVLLPISIKQKTSMKAQQSLSSKVEEIKEMYKNDKEKLNLELTKFYKENAKTSLGGLISFLQLPIVFALYRVIISMTIQSSTLIIPWVDSIKMSDKYYIIPLVYSLVMLCSSLLSYISFLKVAYQPKVSKINLVFISVISILVTFKIPIALGIYFITAGLFSLAEEIVFRIYYKNKLMIN